MDKNKGRPTKYRPKMCFIIEKMMKQGASQIEVMAELRICKETFYRWIDENEEFSRSLALGKLLSQAWWERTGRNNLENKKFNHRGWYMNMKNRFLWSDKPVNKKDENITVIFKSAIPHYPGEQDEDGYIEN